jgi:predicted phosphodiesterase
MRIGVMSDIHGNGVALDAVLADVEHHPVDRWVCLGDAIQGGPQPAQVVDKLRELACPVIMGNADDEVLERNADDENFNKVSDWTSEQLGGDGRAFVRAFVSTCELSLGEAGTLLCFHGTPTSFWDVVLPETPPDELRTKLGSGDAAVMCGGHTHLQWTTTIDGCRRYFNPGSVGLAYNRHLPRDGFHFSPVAEFAVLNVMDADVRLEFCRVPFDLEEFERTTLASGHPFAEQTVARYGL